MKQVCVIFILLVSVFCFSSAAENSVSANEELAEDVRANSVAVLLEAGVSSDLAEKMTDLLSELGVDSADYAKILTDGETYRVWQGTAYYDFFVFSNGIVSCTDYEGNELFLNEALETNYENHLRLLKFNFLEGISSPIKRGNKAEIKLRGIAPGTVCKIKVKYASGSVSKAKGLEEKTADSDGKVSWTWKISSRTGPGVAEITVSGEDFSYVYEMEITD